MHVIINNRIFWIYLIITIFFIIIGIRFLAVTNDNNIIIICILWFLSIVLLMIMVIDLSVKYVKSLWVFVNVLFIFLLIMTVFWTAEFSNSGEDYIKTILGIIILLGALLISILIVNKSSNYIYQGIFWINVCYILIWLSLTLYVTV
jgi:hypothetical protein